MQKVLDMLSHAWAPGTREAYGAGLLVFRVFCDQKVPPVSKTRGGPADEALLLDFLASCAGAYSGTALKNYFYRIRAWHTLHGLPWTMNDTRITAALTAVERLAPMSSRRPKRELFTPEVITKIRKHLDLRKPLDAAVFACLTTTFWSAARLGEFTVPTIRTFDPTRHVKRSDVAMNSNVRRLGLPVTSFSLPWTKCAPGGETVYWSTQTGNSDPEAALLNHFSVNNPSPNDALFSWHHSSGLLRPLSRQEFLKRVNTAAVAAQLSPLQGHGIRIGSVLEYMLCGPPLDVVRTIGRWSSNAFVLYLRKHTTILAPYIQNTPLLEPFTQLAMPHVR